MLRRLSIVMLVLLLLSSPAPAQAQHPCATFSMGRILATAPDQRPVAMNAYLFDYALSWRSSGPDYWKYYHRYPDFGFRLSYAKMPFGVAGNRFGAVGFMQVPIRPCFDWSVGLGLSAYTEPYSATFDKANDYIGSVLNCLIDLGLIYKIPVDDEGTVALQARFLHTSNGYIRKPNLGLNYWQFGIGYDLAPVRNLSLVDPEAVAVTDSVELYFRPSNHVFLSYAPGVVQSRHKLKDGYYYTYTAEVGFLRRFHPCHVWGANLDVMMNGSHPEWLRARHEVPPPAYLGGCVLYEGFYGPMSIRLSIGMNITRSSLIYIPVYERVGLFFHFGREGRQYGGLAMKAYMGHVDYLEWTYGLMLPLKMRLPGRQVRL